MVYVHRSDLIGSYIQRLEQVNFLRRETTRQESNLLRPAIGHDLPQEFFHLDREDLREQYPEFFE